MTFDLVVVGGGPAGLALALAAGPRSVALVSRSAPAGPPAEVFDARVEASDARVEAFDTRVEAFDTRVYALSPANVEFLKGLGAWQAMPQERLTPIHAMEIFGDRGESRLVFDAYRAGVPALAWTVEDRGLSKGLWETARAAAHLKLRAPAEPESLEVTQAYGRLNLRGGEALQGSLIVAADGARSFVREAAGLVARERDYGQIALVANFACERAHCNVALQWFQGGPVLALLPLPQSRVSMIWSLPSARAAELLALDAQALAREVELASRGRLGGLSLLGAPASYPLRSLSARRAVAPRVALVGDAAHVIHPLAGQGLNLGLQDVRTLARVLGGQASSVDAGDWRLLRRYERRRAEPTLAMAATVDGLFRLFGARGEGSAQLRNAGLNLVGRLPVVKNLLMRHAMG